MKRLLVALVLLIVAGGCSDGGAGPGTQPASGGFTGTSAALYSYAYNHCYPMARQAATAQPFGSGPAIYPLSRARPLVAIGKVKPHGSAQMRAVLHGCAAAMVRAFADVHSTKTALICRIQAQFLPPDTPACRSAS